MSKRLEGGYLGARPSWGAGSSSGMWTPEQQASRRGQNIWPSARDAFRYFRFSEFAATNLNANTFELAEAEFYDFDTLLTGITASGNFSWTEGSFAATVDGSYSSVRNYKMSWSSIQPSAIITFDLGSPKIATHLKLFISYGGGLYGPRFPASFTIGGSSDNLSYSTIGTITIPASLNQIEQDLYYATDKIQIFP